MFIGVKELERQKLSIDYSFAPGTIDYRTQEFRQVEPLVVQAVAELKDDTIHVVGQFATRLELPCARCLEPVGREVCSNFDLYYRPVASMAREAEISLAEEDTEIGFYVGDGLFLADALAEQVHLALPMKTLCQEECRGLCPHCGANLNRESCRCQREAIDPRLAPLAEWKHRHEKES